MSATDNQNHQPAEPAPAGSRSPLEQKEFPEVRVIDKRFWAQPEPGPGSTGPVPELNLKPAYVQELEQKMALMEEKFREKTEHFVDESRRIHERLTREMERRLLEEKNKIILELVEVLDNLDLALGIDPARQDLPRLLQGVELVRDSFRKKLEKAGMQAIGAIGEVFDPRFHEAIETRDVTDPQLDDRLVAIWQQGLLANESLVRPARVSVGRFHNPEEQPALSGSS